MKDSKTETVNQYAALVMSMSLDFQMGKITPELYVGNLLLIANQLSEVFNSQSPATIK